MFGGCGIGHGDALYQKLGGKEVNRIATAAFIILLIFLLVAVYLGEQYIQCRRYSIITTQGAVYRLDQKTGQTWFLQNEFEQLVGPKSEHAREDRKVTTQISPEEKAIGLARRFNPDSGSLSLEQAIPRLLAVKRGRLMINGWTADKVNEQTYVVSYTYFTNDETRRGWFVEVNLKVGIVRQIANDPELRDKYGIDSAESDKLVSLTGTSAWAMSSFREGKKMRVVNPYSSWSVTTGPPSSPTDGGGFGGGGLDESTK